MLLIISYTRTLTYDKFDALDFFLNVLEVLSIFVFEFDICERIFFVVCAGGSAFYARHC